MVYLNTKEYIITYQTMSLTPWRIINIKSQSNLMEKINRLKYFTYVFALRYSVNAAAEWYIMAAGACISLVPILIVYALANKQFISGLTAGAVKG